MDKILWQQSSYGCTSFFCSSAAIFHVFGNFLRLYFLDFDYTPPMWKLLPLIFLTTLSKCKEIWSTLNAWWIKIKIICSKCTDFFSVLLCGSMIGVLMQFERRSWIKNCLCTVHAAGGNCPGNGHSKHRVYGIFIHLPLKIYWIFWDAHECAYSRRTNSGSNKYTQCTSTKQFMYFFFKLCLHISTTIVWIASSHA